MLSHPRVQLSCSTPGPNLQPLRSVEAEEGRLRERVREIQTEASQAKAASSSTSPEATSGGGWDSGEAKRLTEVCCVPAPNNPPQTSVLAPGASMLAPLGYRSWLASQPDQSRLLVPCGTQAHGPAMPCMVAGTPQRSSRPLPLDELLGF